MSNQSPKWAEAERLILAALDIEAEYVRMGLRVDHRHKPSQSGWLACHAHGRQDKNPSASINVGDGPIRGRYHDFGGGGESVSFWDFAAQHDGRFRGDWRIARRFYAAQTKIELPDGPEEDPADSFEFFDITAGMLLNYSRKKPGVSAQAIRDLGGRGARYPKGLDNPAMQQQCIAFPMYGEFLLDGEPTGWHVVRADGGKVSVYQGKGNEPKLIKTMTKGAYGLMNVAGLAKLAEAKVVWVVEGITDLLALQTALPAEFEDGAHVAVSAGGASYHPRPEWAQHFAGKDVRICFDVDPVESQEAGQKAAGVWCAAVIGTAATVRNVKLPFTGAADGPKDLRDYFLSGKSYADLWEFSETFTPLKPDSVELARAHEATLARLGIIVIGQVGDTEAIEVFSRSLNKKTTIKAVSRWDYTAAIRDIGGDVVTKHIDRSVEASNGKLCMNDVRDAIAWAGGETSLSKQPAVGVGISKVGELLVLVGARSAYVWDGHKLACTDRPVVNGQRLDFGADAWFEAEELSRLLHLAQDPAWRKAVLEETTLLFARWDNWKFKGTAQLLAGLVLATWVQSIWEFRPQIGIVGGPVTGKTVLLQVISQIFGNLATRCAKPSEAGIRAMIENTFKILLIDEFEADHNRAKVLGLLRTSSRGEKVARSNSAQKAVMHGLKHIAWMFSIELGLSEQADASRFIVLPLKPLNPNEAPKLTVPEQRELAALGQRLLATAIVLAPEALKLAEAIKRHQYGVNVRTAELYSVGSAMYSLAFGDTHGAAIERAGWTLREFAGDERRGETDEEALVWAIYGALVQLAGGARKTVASLINDEIVESAPGTPVNRADALDQVGIKIATYPKRLFVHPKKVCGELLKGTRFKDMDIAQILERIPTSKYERQVMKGSRPRGVSIELAQIHKIIYGEDAESSPDLREVELSDADKF